MENKYVYRGQDITTDVLMKIEHVVRLIAEGRNCDFESAYLSFIDSRTYAALQKTESVMWAESAEFIADEYARERVDETNEELLANQNSPSQFSAPSVQKAPKPGCLKGKIWIADDFDAPLEDFKEYMG